MVNIKEKLLENKHGWSEETVQILTNYFYEFSKVFDGIINVEEVIDDFIKSDNLKNGIIYVDEKIISDEFDATYNFKDLCIRITNCERGEEYLRYILFHELTHAVSKHGNYVGFYDMNNNRGINEGTTELITMFRNNKIEYRFDNNGIYNIVTSLAYLLANILGYTKFFNSFFYGDESLKSLIEQRNMNYNEILNCFEYFIDKDKCFFYNEIDDEFIDYARIIIYNYYDSFGEIDSLEKYEKKIQFISLYMNLPYSLNYIDEYSTYLEICIDRNKLLNLNINEVDIDEILKKNNLYDKEKIEKYIKENEKEEYS